MCVLADDEDEQDLGAWLSMTNSSEGAGVLGSGSGNDDDEEEDALGMMAGSALSRWVVPSMVTFRSFLYFFRLSSIDQARHFFVPFSFGLFFPVTR